jgi:hypothetical protein
MKEYWVLGIRVTDRIHEATMIQDVLTKFGCTIRTRLGLHEIEETENPGAGTILLELTGDTTEFPKLEKALQAIEGIEVRKMVFPA